MFSQKCLTKLKIHLITCSNFPTQLAKHFRNLDCSWISCLEALACTDIYKTYASMDWKRGAVSGSRDLRQAQYWVRMASRLWRQEQTLVASSEGVDQHGKMSRSVSLQLDVGWKPAHNRSNKKLSASTLLGSFINSVTHTSRTRGFSVKAVWSPLNNPRRYLQELSFVGLSLMASTQYRTSESLMACKPPSVGHFVTTKNLYKTHKNRSSLVLSTGCLI